MYLLIAKLFILDLSTTAHFLLGVVLDPDPVPTFMASVIKTHSLAATGTSFSITMLYLNIVTTYLKRKLVSLF